MEKLFIKGIQIDRVRHLENIKISLSETEAKHLILTGKNGSGKTSVLEALAKHMKPVGVGFVGNWHQILLQSDIPLDTKLTCKIPNDMDGEALYEAYEDGEILFAFLPANRTLKLDLPKSIDAVDITKQPQFDAFASKDFVKYMLYLNYQRMSAISESKPKDAQQIEKWFKVFKSALREVYECPALELNHDSKDLSFKIHLPNREPFGLNQMADGYSAFLSIVMELMMRMENKASMSYDIGGIVLIDEIETHLHIELQKKALPFLVKMFPNIQFIVSTHSPFVLSSIPNAIIFDLDKRKAVEDLSAYSYEGIVEYYFNSDMYSNEIKARFDTYKRLVANNNRTSEEAEQLVEVITYLQQIPPKAAEELVYAFREMEEQRRGAPNGKTD